MRLCRECHKKSGCVDGGMMRVPNHKASCDFCEGCGDHGVIVDCHGYDLRGSDWYPRRRDHPEWYPQ